MQNKFIDKTLSDKLCSAIDHAEKFTYQKTHLLESYLKIYLEQIRKKYKHIALKGIQSPKDEWVNDNFYVIEKEGKQLLKQMDKLILPVDDKNTFPQIYLYIREAVRYPSFEFTTESVHALIDFFEQKRYVQNFELDFFINGIKIAAIESIYYCFENGVKDFDSLTLMKRSILLLSDVKTIDINEVIEEKNQLDKILQNDPVSAYIKMSEITKQIYRFKLSKVALKRNMDELALAKEYIQKSETEQKHVGFFIYEDYNKYIKSSLNRKLYLPLHIFIPAVLSVAIALLIGNLLWALLFYFPIWEIIKPYLGYFLSIGVESEWAPRMELNGVIPQEGRTLVVISTLLSNAKEFKKLKAKLEKLYYTNGQGAISFCVLADLKEASMPITAQDRSLISGCEDIIKELNRQYDNKFMLLVRNRTYSKTGNIYTGGERKRGAIADLVRLIKGEFLSYRSFVGSFEYLRNTKYILALDYDTKALLETASTLVSVAMHPLNRPVIDQGQHRVSRGYGIILPKMAVDLKASLVTPFARVMSGLGGVAAYESRSNDIYQDLYEESIFSGKGLIDVQYFYKVLDRLFPSEVILSHDILEGSFLRTRFVSDIEMIDGFPIQATAYIKRLHRWIRGDFQNIPYLFKTIKTQDGTIRNPLNAISRFKIFDNLRRAINPVFSILCFLIAFFMPNPAAIVITVIGVWSVISVFLYGLISAFINRGIFAFTRKYYSNTLTQALELISQAFYHFVLLPQFAYNALDAGIRACYRRFISHKKMLEWTTAAQTERKKHSKLNIFMYYLPATAAGVFFLFSPHIYLRIVGALFCMTLFLVVYSQKKYPKPIEQISNAQKETLTSYFASMWEFYREYTGKKDHYLPPDNVQEAPVYKVAHRTSPTNIGLYLLSVLSARDFDIIRTDEMVTRLHHTIATVESLDKWNGNLYNWYDTQTKKLLKPEYVSTVDSGNFLCCLITLKEGLREYIAENKGIEGLVQRIEALIENTDLSVFYDKNMRLFSIGYDIPCKKLSPSHYDLLMSEARMTCYYAIAKRQVPKKLWSSLGRTLAKLNSYAGPVSWSGTMFEYFMPELFLKSVEGSMSYEGLKFCLYSQKMRARQKSVPFGISESGFYAFDTELNYQYKAHGVQKLALKRGMNEELVVSPYSSYLTLSQDFQGSYRNLNWLKRIGAYGKYGHYEAVDYTSSRIGNDDFKLVRSYMAHHVGMSMLAVNNTLNDNIMQNRFLRDKFMNSASELLQEKVLEGTSLFEDVFKRDDKKKNLREVDEQQEFKKTSPAYPHVKLLSNGEVTSIITDSGSNYMLYRGQNVIRQSKDLLRRPSGLFAAVRDKNQIFSFKNAPLYDGQERKVVFDTNNVTFQAEKDGLQLGMMTVLHSNYACEQNQFIIKNTSGHQKSIEFMAYLEPALCKYEDDVAHPAFSKLFVQIGYDFGANVVTAKRKKRKDEQTVCMAVGFLEDIPFAYEACREKIMKRPYGVQSVFSGFDEEFSGGVGTPDPCIAIKFKTQLPAKSQKDFTLLVSAGSSIEQAIEGILHIRRSGFIEKKDAAKSPIIYNSIEGRLASVLLPQLLYNITESEELMKTVKENKLRLRDLWGLGISGDLPLVLVEVENEKDSDRVKNYISCHHKLKITGIHFDLIFLYKEGGDYSQPLKKMLDTVVSSMREENKVGKRGGIHYINTVLCEERILFLVKAAACHISSGLDIQQNLEVPDYMPITIRPVQKDHHKVTAEYSLEAIEFHKDSVLVKAEPHLPWCHIMANPSFGTLVSDKALGFTWAVNSRENKLTPWFNDTMSDNRGEMLLVCYEGQYYDLVNGSSAEFNPAYARYSGKIEGLRSTVCVSIAQTGMVKYLDVELENTKDKEQEITLAYYIEPVLDVDRKHARQISSQWEDGILYLRNPFNQSVHSYVGILAESEQAAVLCNRAKFLGGQWEKEIFAPVPDPCAALIIKKKLPPKSTEKIQFILSFASTKEGIRKQLVRRHHTKPETSNSIYIDTPDKSLNYLMNTWLSWQTKASRLYGRTGFAQNGGAYGFRDQLQDVCAYVYLEPEITKKHILRACASQFEEGDVLHWWHNLPEYGGGKKGVRTRYSDDLLWLPYTVCEYIEKTNDYSILDYSARYCTGPVLEENEHEKYIETGYTDYKESVYDHCLKAIEKAYALGEHSLPLIGCGDWNDGFNQVGEEGKGESVWLAQFLSIVLSRFAKLCSYKKERERAEEYIQRAKDLLQAVDEHCWDGSWYIRAFFDNREPMGSHVQEECKIDSLAQSFSVLSGMPDTERIQKAMDSAYNYLVDTENDIVKLFTKAYENSHQNPGYVKSYPPGVRENGGQYTHGAVWYAMALIKMGDIERGYQVLKMLSPVHKYENPVIAKRYKLEPYYIAADVYYNQSNEGRGGWSIYTGAAGWYYRVVLEHLLGLQIKGGKLYITPMIPQDWEGFSVQMHYQGTKINIQVKRTGNRKITDYEKTVDFIELDHREHAVKVEI